MTKLDLPPAPPELDLSAWECPDCGATVSGVRGFCSRCSRQRPAPARPSVDERLAELEAAGAIPPASGSRTTRPALTTGPVEKILALALVVVLLAGVATAVARSGSGRTSGTTPAAEASHPDTWDPRVEPIAHFVEQQRGLLFRHPVAVNFLSVDEFKRRFANDKAPTAKEEADLRDAVATLRAVGLAQGDVDLRGGTSQLLQTSVLGYYSDRSKKVYVRGSELTADVRETLAHELTHALQDQHYDLRRYAKAGSGVSTAYRALFEADAVRVQDAFDETLPREQQQALDTLRGQQLRDANAATGENLPEALSAEFEFPYAFGPAFVAVLLKNGGNDAVDRAFDHPPRSEAQIVDPQSYLSGAEVVPVAAPRLGGGQTRLDKPYDVGQVSMLMLLGARLDYRQAWGAVRGWAGDQAVAYRQGGRVCVVVDTALRTSADTEAFATASSAWAASMPAAANASATRAGGNVVELRSCDAGKNATGLKPTQPSPFKVLALRAEIIAGAVQGEAPYPLATCAADKLVDKVGAAAMVDAAEATSSTDPRVKKLVTVGQQAGLECARAQRTRG